MKTDRNELKIELRGETEVVATRYFAAPRQLVFDCHTRPELMRRWLIGPPGMVLDTIENDLRVGGKYLYVYADSKGGKLGVYGKFLEVIVPEKFANTENYAMDMSAFDPNAPEDPAATVESRHFKVEGDGTRLTHVIQYASPEVREMFGTGAADGLEPSYLELDKLLLEIG